MGMKARLPLCVTLPIMAISAVPLAVGVATAWNVHRSQKQASDALALNVTSLRAAEEIAIGVRDVRRQLDLFLQTGQRRPLEGAPGLRRETDRGLAEAERAAVTPRERELIAHVRQGSERFFGEYDHLLRSAPAADLPQLLRERINDALTRAILHPAQQYLDYNEEEIARSTEDNQDRARRVILSLALLGVCG